MCSGPAGGAVTYAAIADTSGISQLDAQGFLLDPSNPASGLVGTSLGGLPVWTAYRTAAHIARAGGTWGDYAPNLEVSYSFGIGVTLPTGYEAFSTPEAQQGAQRAMALYAEVCGLTFTEAIDPAAANITYMFGIGSQNGGGWANYPTADGGYVHVGHVSWEAEMLPGTYSLNLLLHELGHGVGLAHPGDYNGSTAAYTDADHFNDSAQYTNMSYWSETYTGASFTQLSTLGLHDILAAQMEYGVNWSTRNTNTVYGFNCTAGSNSYDFAFDASMGFCIWDGGGIDRLDFSGFTDATVLDLRDGSFSSTGAGTYSVSIAYGAVIENGVGGSGSDKMRGNDTGNRLEGGAGHDTIYGGSEAALVLVANPRDFVGVSLNEAPLTRNQYLALSGVTAFSGAQFSFEELVKIKRVPSDALEFASYNVSGNDNQFIFEGANDGFLRVTLANGATHVTTIKTETIVDGNPHRLSLTWNKADGALKIYIDGALSYSATYAAGALIKSGGTLIIGQEQDSVGGGFDATQVLAGVAGDIRIFNDVRTAAEVSANAFARLTGTEQGLQHNWQVKTTDTTSITDAAHPAQPSAALQIVNGGAIVDTAPSAVIASDNDTLIGGGGNDQLFGGAGNDSLVGSGTLSAFAAMSAIRLNEMDANQYLEIANYAGFAGSAGSVQFTLEMVVAGLSGATELVSFATASSTNAFTVTITAAGVFEINYRNSTVTTAISAAGLLDSKEHRFSISFDARSTGDANSPGHGAFVIYVDGAAVGSGTHANWNASMSSGTLIFGQEQDSLGGGFNSSQILDGSVADIRIFNDIRTASEISSNAFSPLPDPASTQGLVSNWRADANSIANKTVSDAKGGTALSIVGYSAPTREALNGAIGGIHVGAVRAVGQALSTSSFTGFSGGAFTVEMVLKLGPTAATDTTLMTYGPNWAIELEFVGSTLKFTVPGNSARYDTGITFASLNDGQPHRLSLSYQAASGAIAVYVDGVAKSSGTYVPGATIASGGRLAFGHDLDSGGQLDNAGDDVTIGDIRIFNDVRTISEIAANAAAPLANPASEAGLIANWQVAANSIGNGAIADALGGGALAIEGLAGVAPTRDLIGAWDNDTLSGGLGNDTLTGGAGNDSLDGGLGADVLNGGAGTDTLIGGGGDDVYYVESAADIATESTGQGLDTVYASASYTLAAGSEIEIMRTTSTTAGITLTGNDFANRLYSGAQTDTLAGGGGNDWYFVNSSSDRVIEQAGRGFDTLYTSVNYALAAGTSVDAMRANAGAAGLALTGNELANSFYGGGGTDTFAGGLGNDTYYIDAAADQIVEAAGQGVDRLEASVSYTLAAGVEVEVLRANSAAAGITLTGNELANQLYSGAYADTLAGGSGNDWYFVNSASDRAVEQAGRGFDTLYTSVNYTLAAGTSIDGIRANAGTMGLALTGNELANYFFGRSGADTLTGGLGNDTFVFEAGLGAVDIITDFSSSAAGNNDTIWLDDAVFTALFNGTSVRRALSASQFAAGVNVTAQSASQVVLYDTASGALFYDADGSGAGAKVQFATLSAHPVLTFADVEVV